MPPTLEAYLVAVVAYLLLIGLLGGYIHRIHQ